MITLEVDNKARIVELNNENKGLQQDVPEEHYALSVKRGFELQDSLFYPGTVLACE
ncbi:hypothetical protein D3C73_565700 [compost metagenome]